MATKAGGVYIEVTAEFAKINSELTKLSGQIRKLGEDSKTHFEAFNKATELAKTGLEAMGVAMSAGAILEYVKNVVETTAQLSNLAKQVDFNVESLQALSVIGKEFGVSTDTIQTALMRLSKAVGGAADDNAGLQKTFDELGITIRDQANNIRPTEDVLNDFADVMATIPDYATRAKYETELLGRGAALLDPMFRKGSEGMKEMKDEAQATGLVIGKDDVEALHAMSVATEEADARIRVSTAHIVAGFKDIWLAILDDIGAVRDLAKADNEAAAQFSTWKQVVDLTKQEATLQAQIAQITSGSVPNKFGGVIAAHTDLKALEDQLVRVRGEIAALGEDAKTATGHIADVPRGDLIIVPGPATEAKGGKPQQTEAEKQAAAIAKVVEQLQFENEQLGMSSEFQKMNTALRQAGVEITTAEGQRIANLVHLGAERAAQIAAENKLEQDAKTLKEQLLSPQEKYNALLDEYNQMLAKGLITSKQHDAAIAASAKAVEQASPEYQKAIAEQKELQSAIESAAGSLLNDLGRAFTDSGTAADRWKNFLQHALQDVMSAFDSLIKKLAGSAITSLLGDLGGATLGSIFGGGSAVLGPLAGSPMLTLASGGGMGIGDWAIVGEAGPELVYADTPGNVLSAERTRGVFGGGGGDSGPTAYIDARGADVGAVARIEAALRTLNYSIEHRAIAAVGNERKRGGAFAAAFNR